MAQLPDGVKLTWLGHSTFLLEAQGKRVLIEAWTKSNPAFDGLDVVDLKPGDSLGG